MSKYVLGLDVGISSVGWGIIDYETSKIVDCGVRLFPERLSDSNETRREMRGSRRLLRRRQHRINRLKDLLIKNSIIDSNFKELDNPYDIRCKGLYQQLSNEELATAILHIAKNRGVTGEWTVDEKTAKDEATTKGILSVNNKLLKDKYICEIQKERLLKEGKIRGINNSFTTSEYVRELTKILSNQKINQEIQEEIIKIIKSRREYYDGPGNEKSITKYGRFFINEYGEIDQISMIDKMKGKCTVYPEEYRAAKNSYSACLFNFLNDLNNIVINNEKIDIDTKKYIIHEYINKKGGITVKQLQKELNVDTLENSGLRVNAKGDLLITEFTSYKKIKKIIDDNKLNVEIYENKILFDKIIEILTSDKGISERKAKLEKIFNFSDSELDLLSNLTGISGYHSLSKKALDELNEEMLNSDMNQMQILQMNGLLYGRKNYKGLQNIPFNNDLILSSTAKRSQKEAIKVINAIKSKYNIDSIVIEMAREKNSEEKRKNISSYLKEKEIENKKIDEILKDKNVKGETRLKVKLYLEQDAKTAYTGEGIDLNRLISDPTAYEIDHIIPLSISLNDSLNNKVLVSRKENQEKGQRTPYQYFMSKNVGRSYEDFKEIVKSNKNLVGKYGYNKRGNLLFEKDINQYDVKKSFINRNLVDTRYATRGILNTISQYFKDNELETKVYTINGNITHMFRKKCGLEKDRELDSSHHAIDALIIAGVKKMKLLNNLLEVERFDEITYDKKTGEIITLNNEKDFFDQKYLEFIGNLRAKTNIKYSYRIDSKYNKQISDQTIYGTRKIDNIDYVIGKYSNIYDKDGEKVAELFRKNKTDKLLLSKTNNDSEHSVYYTLKSVVDNYKNEKNPFQAFYKETGEYIRKYSKKGDGPIIKSIKYIDGKIGESVIYLDNKYSDSKKERHIILKQLVPYRTDVYKSQEGTYKLLLIYQVDLSFNKNNYYIKEDKYNSLKDKYNIDVNDKFMFSLYKESIINIDGEYIRYAGIMNAPSGLIYYKTIGDYKIYKSDNKTIISQPYINIKHAKIFEKYNVNVLGDMYKSTKEACKLEIDVL